MSISDQLTKLRQEESKKYKTNIDHLNFLEQKGHKIEVKTSDVIYFDEQYMVYLSERRFHDLKNNIHGSLDETSLLELI